MSWPSTSSASTSSRTAFPPLSPTTPTSSNGTSSASSSLLLPSSLSSSSPSSSSPVTISRRRSVKAPHPLSSINTKADSDQDDATRPTLTRRTTETREELERVGRSSESSDGGLRQSLELSRKGKSNIDGGVDVLVHEVQPNDSLAKVALLYGIELSILRKANKLWTSDTIHLRRTLYVPLEACRLRETVVHGPGPDQVTLLSSAKPSASTINGRTVASSSSAHLRSRTTTDESSGTGGGWNTPSLPGSRRGSTAGSEGGSSKGLGAEWDEEGFVAKRFLGGTSMIYSSSEVDDQGIVNLTPSSSSSSSPAQGGSSSSARYTPSSSFPASSTSSSSPPPLLSPIPTSFVLPGSSSTSASAPPSNERILSLLRIPASELSFFPKSTTSAPLRSSLDSRLPPILSYSSSPKSPIGGPSSFRTSPTTTISRSSTASRPSQQQHLLNTKRSSPSLSSRLTSLFVVGDPFPTPSLSPSPSTSTLRPAFQSRTRSASSSAHLYPSSSSSSSNNNPPLSISTKDADDFELTPTSSTLPSRVSSPPGSATRRTDWFAQAQAQPEPIRKQLEPAKPMMVNVNLPPSKGRRVGDGLGNGSDLGVLI